MDLCRALLLTLATTSLPGCYLHCRFIPEQDYALTAPITSEELDRLVENFRLESVEELKCEYICGYAYERDHTWRSSSVSTCELVQPPLESEAEPENRGTIRCEGRAVEYFCKGRRPLGHVDARAAEAGDGLAWTLAEMAQLEAASVLAFEQLADQLIGFDAPAAFVERCRSATADERRHARWLTALAEARGARVVEPRIEEGHAPDRLSIAMHNAVEGCVHEAFAALVAAWIARDGADPVLRKVYARIAEDETRHGQLAWDLHAWLRSQLSTRERELVEAAQRAALASLPARVAWLAELPSEFGVIPAALAEQLATKFVDALASEARLGPLTCAIVPAIETSSST